MKCRGKRWPLIKFTVSVLSSLLVLVTLACLLALPGSDPAKQTFEKSATLRTRLDEQPIDGKEANTAGTTGRPTPPANAMSVSQQVLRPITKVVAGMRLSEGAGVQICRTVSSCNACSSSRACCLALQKYGLVMARIQKCMYHPYYEAAQRCTWTHNGSSNVIAEPSPLQLQAGQAATAEDSAALQPLAR